jgi:hypothetical protein
MPHRSQFPRISTIRRAASNFQDFQISETQAQSDGRAIARSHHVALSRPLKNGNLLRQRKNPDRASAQYTARPGFFASVISPFLNDLYILIFSTIS